MVTDLKRETASGTVLRDDALTYALDPANNPYVSQDVTTDSTGPSPVYSQREQTLDQYGNILTSSIWDWSATAPSGSSGWKRQYTSTDQGPVGVGETELCVWDGYWDAGWRGG
jgi:hypothetical protein